MKPFGTIPGTTAQTIPLWYTSAICARKSKSIQKIPFLSKRHGERGIILTKLKSFLKRVLHIKIRTKLILLILITGALCLTLFRFLWHRKWNTYYFLAQNLPSSMKFFPTPDDDFWGNLIEEAKKYNVPDSEDDKEAVRAIEPFFSLADE